MTDVSLAYNAEGQLRRLTRNGETTELQYDGSDQLIARHIHGPGIDEPLLSIDSNGHHWHYADHQGGVIAIHF